MELGRSLWPLVWETVVVLPALLVAMGVVIGGALRLEGLARGLAVAAGLGLAFYELQGLFRTLLATGSFVDVPTELFFGWSLATLPLYLVTVLLFVGAALAPRGTAA